MPPDLSAVVPLLEAQRDKGWHDCAQVYASQRGEVLLDAAIGESRPGRPLSTDDLMLWYSSGKPWTAAAVLQLWEAGRLGLDDLVATYVDGWGNGKERATLRHVLTHTGGFPMPGDRTYDREVSWSDAVAAVAESPATWEPGTAAGYHPTSGWRILGAVVEAVDGRPVDRYVHEEIAVPLGLADSHLGIPLELQRELGDRIVPVAWTGYHLPRIDDDGTLQMVPYTVDRWHNEPWHIAKVEPGAGMRGPARDLGRFYESLLGVGPEILEPRTVEVMRAVHRFGLKDATLQTLIPWGLGVQVDFTGGTTWHAYGHNGMASSRGIADPSCGLVLVVVANGVAGFLDAGQRLLQVTDAVYSALGDEVAHLRRPVGSAQGARGPA
jgi:CubicO group peptidase (beta-lactamase class C family)